MKCNFTLIKMCGITRDDDAQRAVLLGIDYLGFVFYESSPRFIEPKAAQSIIQRLGPRTKAVGLFVNHDRAFVSLAVEQSRVDVLQFHGTESPQFCEEMSAALGLPYWKAVHVGVGMDSDDLLKSCFSYSSAQALLFDTASPGLINHWGGTGQSFEWQTLAPLVTLKNVPLLVLSGGLSVQNVAQGIELLNPWGVDVSSGIEVHDAQGKPCKGIKDPTKMADFVKAVRSIQSK
jgi:phosphoribosylanthranilate isomerase